MEQKTWFIRTGDFFFKYRNMLFPVLLFALFCIKSPPDAYYGDAHLEDIKDYFAIGFVLLGLGLRATVIGFRYIKRGGMDKKVYAKDLVTDGFFAACRNPLYVGNLIIYFGVLLMHGAPIVVLVGSAFFLFVYSAIVAAEEFFLRGKFGEGYAAYCRDVPRWGIRLDRLRESTHGMRFNFRRVLAKDYSTVANAVVAMVGLSLWEDLAATPLPVDELHWVQPLCIILATLLLALAIRTAKKRGLLREAV